MIKKREKLTELIKGQVLETSQAVNCTPQMLNAIARGDRNPSLPLAKRIADYFETTVDELFYGENGNESFLYEEVETA